MSCSVRAAKSKSSEEQREKARLRAKKWRLNNPIKFKEKQKECYQKNKEYYLSKASDYRINHKEERRKYDLERKNELPYRKILLTLKIPINCKMCSTKENVNGIQMSVHHIDGNHNNNEVENLVWICERCHQYIHNPEGIHSEMVVLR